MLTFSHKAVSTPQSKIVTFESFKFCRLSASQTRLVPNTLVIFSPNDVRAPDIFIDGFALQQHVKLRAASSATFAWSSFFSLRLLLRFNHSSLTNSFTSSSSTSANFQRSLLQAETLLLSSPLASRLPSTASSKLAISFISRNSQHYIKSMHSRKLKNSTFISDGWASCTNSYIIALWNSNHQSKAWAITLS